MEFQAQSFVYSSDHNNDPSLHKKIFEEGVLSKERYEELASFPWDSDVIYHEAGIPPLHTPIAHLDSMAKNVKKNTVIYHIAQKDFPEKTDLTLAKFGIEHTRYFKAKPPRFEQAYRILGILKNLDFLQEITIEKAMEFLDIVEEVKYKKDQLIIEKGTSGDMFYIILSGNVSVDSGNLDQRKIYSTYEYFGEVAVLTGGTRAADVRAETDCTLYTIKRDQFLNFITGTEFEQTLHRLIKIRTSETWNLLSNSSFFRHCTASQKTWLESIFIPEIRKGSGILQKEGTPIDVIYIIRDGSVTVSREGKKITSLSKGDAIGAIQKMHRDEPAAYTFEYSDDISLFIMEKHDILRFVDHNPGLLMKLTYDF